MLTDLECQKAEKRAKPFKLADAGGLYLYVLPSGFKSWRWKYRFAGKEKRLVFGPYPEVKLTAARRARDAAREQLRAGIDPALHKRQRIAAQAGSADTTFRALAEQWVEDQRPTWSPRYATTVERSLKANVFPSIGNTAIGAITTPMVLELLRKIERRGAIETAHRSRQHISEVFARAIGAGLVDQDPSQVVARTLKPVVKRKFPAARTIIVARAVLKAAEERPGHPTVKLASRLLALTAVRSAVARLAEPDEFEDLDGAAPLWRIPATKMKLVAEHKADEAFEFLVPLSRQAVDTIKAAMRISGGAPLIFRSIRNGRRPISDSTISKAYRDAGYSGIHVPHGWRATFSTVMNEIAGAENRPADRAVIDLMLAHVPQGVEGVYNRAWYMPRRREIAQRWADLLTEGLAEPDQLLEGPRSH